MAAFRNLSLQLSKAVPTISAASDSTSIIARPGHFRFGASSAVSLETSGGVQRTLYGRRQGFSSLARQPSIQAPAQSRPNATGIAQPYPEGLEMEGEDKPGTEEVVAGCRVRHGELCNKEVNIHYVECGDKSGELVVLIHGFPNFWYIWKNQFQALAEAGYHVVAPDLRGYNASSKPQEIQDYARTSVVSDIVRLIEELGGGKPATVVGHDWGGFVTWSVAEDFPNKVKKAVVVNIPHVTVFAEALRSNFSQLRRSWYMGLFQLPWIPELMMTSQDLKGLMGIWSRIKFQPLDIDRHRRAYKKAGTLKGIIHYYRAAGRGYWSPASDAGRPSRVELPVDLIWGELDTFLGIELAVIPTTIASNTVIKRLPNCAHWPMWDDPEQFNIVLLESLSSQRPTSAGHAPASTNESTVV